MGGGLPKADDVTHDGLKLLLKANEDCTAYYVVLADGAAAPAAAEVKNGTGKGGVMAIKSGNMARKQIPKQV